ncbi:MAG: erythromycin esterase family protein [Acidimicrobiia bacterium]|nr:erythromycin esterase family protein [Acidimicrobiia bacterium]
MQDPAVTVVRQHAIRLTAESAASRMLDAIDERASLVLIGEATHGTHEFYRIRADVTRALIEQRGFGIVAAEADWPDAYRANRWVRLLGDDETAEAALGDFTLWRPSQNNREGVGPGSIAGSTTSVGDFCSFSLGWHGCCPGRCPRVHGYSELQPFSPASMSSGTSGKPMVTHAA